MIKEGSYLYTEGGPAPVVPFTGKYAVKSADVFAQVDSRWQAAGLGAGNPYRPMRVECELTTKCNDTCPTCGMGALPLSAGRTLSDGQIRFLVRQFESVGLPSVAITGGEPFTAMHALLAMIRELRGRIDVSKLTTNGLWGSTRRCVPTFGQLEDAGLFEGRWFVPTLMVSIGEQTTPLEYTARILHHGVTRYTERELTLAVSSLADPATRVHKVDELIRIYERMFGGFPHDRVHSTMRVYLPNERLEGQAPINRPGHTTIARWMDRCYDCFAPTVGAYVLPTGLMKQNGDFYACAAFNVPEQLNFGNLLREPFRTVLNRVNASGYVAAVRAGGGLKGVAAHVDPGFTHATACDSFCGSCALLIEQFDAGSGSPATGHRVPVVATAADLLAGVPAARTAL